MTGIFYMDIKHSHRSDKNVILFLVLVQHGSVLQDICCMLSCLMGIHTK